MAYLGNTKLYDWTDPPYPVSASPNIDDIKLKFTSSQAPNGFSRDPPVEPHLSYFGSKFYMTFVGAAQPIPHIRLNEMFESFFSTGLQIGDSTGNLGVKVVQWEGSHFLYSGGPANFYGVELEGKTAFINAETILSKSRIFTGKMLTNAKEIIFKTNTISASTIKARNDIGGKYFGFEVGFTRSCTGSFCNKIINLTYLVVYNNNPAHYTIGANTFQANFEPIQDNFNRDISTIITLKQYEAQVETWFLNRDAYLQATEDSCNEWIGYFKRPQFITDTKMLRAYYRNALALWHLVEHKGNWEATSNFGTRYIFVAGLGYNGTFITDAAYMIRALLDGMKMPLPLKIINLIKDNILVYVDNLNTDGGMPGSIRDSAKQSSTANGTGFFQEVYKYYQVTGDLNFVTQIYPYLKSDMAVWYLKAKNELIQGSLGDGMPQGYLIDLNSQFYLNNLAMAEMAKLLGNTSDETLYKGRAMQISDQIGKFWNAAKNYFFDLDLNFNYSTFITEGKAFAYDVLQAGIPGITQAQVDAMAAKVNDPQYYGTPYRMADIAVKNTKYNQATGCHLWWCGNAWSLTAYRAYIGLMKYGKTVEAKAIRDAMFKMISDYGIGKEYYDSTAVRDLPSSACTTFYGWTAANYVQMGNVTDWLDFTNILPPPGTPTFDSLGASPNPVQAGQAFSITGTTTNADAVTISGPNTEGLNPQQLPADFTVSNLTQAVAGSYVYFFKATGPGSEAKAQVTVTVTSPPADAPQFTTLNTAPAVIKVNKPFTISGTVINSTAVYMSGPDIEGLNEKQILATFSETLTLTQIGGYRYYFRAINASRETKAQLILNVVEDTPNNNFIKFIISSSLLVLILFAVKKR